MSVSDRQNRLLVAEDWKRIYQNLQNVDFQSYDFENLRRVMIQYIKENYPEDFNDYIESSEYLALIDLIAFLGQNLSFRIDLNARDNFLELAERRESVLRLSRLLGYKSKRNLAANGLLKFTTVSTSQQIVDSNGRNLAGQVITWNDPTNSNWYDQFIKVINAALPTTNKIGNFESQDLIYGITTEQYRFESTNIDVPLYEFSKTVDGRQMSFEVVSTAISGKDEIYEEPPKLRNRLSFLYRDDGKGNSSLNTGFFILVKQGTLNNGVFTLNQPSPNETIDIEAENINNTDIWLYKLDQNNEELDLWTQVPEIEGNNIIYNSLKKNVKNIFSVVSRENDKVSLIFSDGVFGNLPQGTFRVYYRNSNNSEYVINSRDIKNVLIDVPYVSNLGQRETLTISLSLETSITNSKATESNSSIKLRAPATFYTQNRMITAEDYNITPLSVSQEVVKVKSINRTSSGISRYFDLIDPTGKYSKTNLFADDGVIYRQFYNETINFTFNTKTDIENVIYNKIVDILKHINLRNFYYTNFTKIQLKQFNIFWFNRTLDINQSTGYIKNIEDEFEKVSTYTSTLLKYFTEGALIKFEAPIDSNGNYTHYFDRANKNILKPVPLNQTLPVDSSFFIWTKIIKIVGDGTNNNTGILVDGTGPIILNDIIPDPYNNNMLLAPRIVELIPAWKSTIESGTILSMVELIFLNKPFGLRYDINTSTWKIITETNLNSSDIFTLGRQGDTSNQKIDSSWLLLFTSDTEKYTVKYRLARYIFESDQQVRFFYDSSDKIYDVKNNTIIKDLIKILSINLQPNSLIPYTYDKNWEITKEYIGLDGYVDSKKIEIAFNDSDDDGVVDDPTLFEQLVDVNNNTVELKNKYIVLEKYIINQGQEDYRYVSNQHNLVIFVKNESEARTLISSQEIKNGQYFYFEDIAVVKKVSLPDAIFSISNNYKVFLGRDKIKFQYIHNADYEARIDPGLTNIIDVYVLTKDYDIKYRQWLTGTIDTEPLAPSSDFLFNLLANDINQIKSLSDEIIYHPVKYKVLFGEKADIEYQATFKVVKNKEIVISDNDVKIKILEAINNFFNLENWDFGENFYFSELNAYVMKELSPNIVSFTIVPKKEDLLFGSMFEINSEKDQIFVSGVTINDIEIIPAITSTLIKSLGQSADQNNIIIKQSITSSGSI